MRTGLPRTASASDYSDITLGVFSSLFLSFFHLGHIYHSQIFLYITGVWIVISLLGRSIRSLLAKVGTCASLDLYEARSFWYLVNPFFIQFHLFILQSYYCNYLRYLDLHSSTAHASSSSALGRTISHPETSPRLRDEVSSREELMLHPLRPSFQHRSRKSRYSRLKRYYHHHHLPHS